MSDNQTAYAALAVLFFLMSIGVAVGAIISWHRDRRR